MDTEGTASSDFAFKEVDIDSLVVEDCGGVSAGDNQYHSLYLSSCVSANIGHLRIRNQSNGNGMKIGSSSPKATGSVHIGHVDVDGIWDQGFISVFEPCESLTLGTGTVRRLKTYGLSLYAGDHVDTGRVIFREDDASGPKSNTNHEPAIRVRGNMGDINLSGSTFRGWLDGSQRRGILNVISIDPGFSVESLNMVGTRCLNLRGHVMSVPASSSIKEVNIDSPTVEVCGGVFNVLGDIEKGSITGINARLGSFTNSWVLPARNPLLTVTDNTLTVVSTTVRMNDSRYARHSNITAFDTSVWIDTQTGVAVTPASYDMEMPDQSLADGFVGKIFYNGVWENFGAIS